jgi:hypothetical protein
MASVVLCVVVAACSTKPSSTPQPRELADGIYRFSDSRAPLTQPIEGTMTVLHDTVMVDAQPGPCRYDDKISWGSHAIVYRCAEMTLTFDRSDPVRSAKFDTIVMVDQKKTVCVQYQTTPTGQRVCVQQETQLVPTKVPVSGLLHPNRVSKTDQPPVFRPN